MENTEKNQHKLANSVVDVLMNYNKNFDEIDTDLIEEMFYNLLIFYYKHISEEKFKEEIEKLKIFHIKNDRITRMKCDSCRYKRGEVLASDECSGRSYFEYCAKGHWEGSGLQNENLEWEKCPDFWEKCIDYKEK